MSISISPIPIKSLGLPPEVEPIIQRIANSGPTTDLDTVAELLEAGKVLKGLEARTNRAVTQLGRAIVVEGDEVYNYFLREEKRGLAYLMRRNLKTNKEGRVNFETGICARLATSNILKMVTDGKVVYLLFDSEGSNHMYIGKLVPSKNGKPRVAFFDCSPFAFGFPGDLVRDGEKVYVSGISAERHRLPVSIDVKQIKVLSSLCW